jgi:hypothetical protein
MAAARNGQTGVKRGERLRRHSRRVLEQKKHIANQDAKKIDEEHEEWMQDARGHESTPASSTNSSAMETPVHTGARVERGA